MRARGWLDLDALSIHLRLSRSTKAPETLWPSFHALRHAHVSHLLRNSRKTGHGRSAIIPRVPIFPGGADTRPFALLKDGVGIKHAHMMPGHDEEAAKRTDAGLRKALKSTMRIVG